MIKSIITRITTARKVRKLKQAVITVESHGMAVVQIINRAGTDYIRAADGSLHKIGRK
jgi:hypothetical protein